MRPIEAERGMIARHWRGWTKLLDAEAYEALLRDKVLPALQGIEGYRGGYVLRSDGQTESEFVVINFFESLDAVKAFAGPDYRTPVFEPEAKALLSRIETVANHYEVRVDTSN
jgi:heme-degrading monooxygenase HmoA